MFGVRPAPWLPGRRRLGERLRADANAIEAAPGLIAVQQRWCPWRPARPDSHPRAKEIGVCSGVMWCRPRAEVGVRCSEKPGPARPAGSSGLRGAR